MAKSSVYKRGKPQVGFNMTPMIDCTFQLIIFFMLTTQMASAEFVPMQLPRPLRSVAKEMTENKVIVNVVPYTLKEIEAVPARLGIAKEFRDARDGSGFSFADLSADMAGGMFASAVLSGRLTLSELARSFTVEEFQPPVDGLDEGISWEDFRCQYGSAHDDRFYEVQAAICTRILALPGHQRQEAP